MRVSAGKLRPSIFIGMTVLAGSAALAFETNHTVQERSAAVFPTFIGERQFLELVAAHKALTDRDSTAPTHLGGPTFGAVAALPTDSGARARAEELSQRFYRPAVDTPVAADEPGPVLEAAVPARDIAARAGDFSPPAVSEAAPPPAQPPPSKVGAAPPDAVKTMSRPAAATPRPPAQAGTRVRKAAKAPVGAALEKIPPAPAPKRRLAARADAYVPPSSARGALEAQDAGPPAALSLESPASSLRARVMPTELQAFGWD